MILSQRCLRCRLSLLSPSPLRSTPSQRRRDFHETSRRLSNIDAFAFASTVPTPPAPARPSTGPKPQINIKQIRANPALYEETCRERNYPSLAPYPARIVQTHEQWQARRLENLGMRKRLNELQLIIATKPESPTRALVHDEARHLKAKLSTLEAEETRLQNEIHSLALALPNLTSATTPRGDTPRVLSYINTHPDDADAPTRRVWRSHVDIGTSLQLLDFASAAAASGWGWYYLLNEGAQLEQALVSYALATATRYGWAQVSPPSMVYSHVAAACGFQPRVGDGEAASQVYTVAQSAADRERGRPELCMTGTAEIALAGMRAGSVMEEASLPARRVAVSRCYRAEAGARGAETRGLYRVHEFTKVELFAWTRPDAVESEEVFEEMVDMQTEILSGLGLHCRVLEMPSGDLGASASRKNDIEAWFPSRARRDVGSAQKQQQQEANKGEQEDEGWGEVTSASICTDYQTRRLGTRVRITSEGGKMKFAWTVNGTAMAVPRVLAAILENGWDEAEQTVTIPEVLRPWMDGREKIGGKENPLH